MLMLLNSMMPINTANSPMNHRACTSRVNSNGPPRKAVITNTNGNDATIMNIVDVHSILGFLKNAIDSSCVEYPPVAMVVIAWLNASRPLMPEDEIQQRTY